MKKDEKIVIKKEEKLIKKEVVINKDVSKENNISVGKKRKAK